MRAMVLHEPGQPLYLEEVDEPEPEAGQVAIDVAACGICRTDLHVLDGELSDPKLPLIMGHQIVGHIASVGEGVDEERIGERVGVPWLGRTCGRCGPCRRDEENLCDRARFTGYQLDGGYAERAVVDVDYAFDIPDHFDDVEAAPLLCAGLIGYRSLRKCGEAETIGLYGFGSAASIIAQVATHQGRRVGAFVRPGDEAGKTFAKKLGASWAEDSDRRPPETLDAAIIFAPVGELVVEALKSVRKGGAVICGGIHMSDIPSFSYDLLWGERRVESVANLTRADGGLLPLAAEAGVEPSVTTYPLDEANDALDDLRAGRVDGSLVLTMS